MYMTIRFVLKKAINMDLKAKKSPHTTLKYVLFVFFESDQMLNYTFNVCVMQL